MPTHIGWNSIELLHNVVRRFQVLSEQGTQPPRVTYQAKVKLHGSNCAVQVMPDGVFAQSRTTLLSPGADYKGFASWVENHSDYFRSLPVGAVVFGEWCGPGVEKGVAISQTPKKLFAVFGVQLDGRIVFEPAEIRKLAPPTGAPSELHVLPWEGESLVLDFASKESLEAAASELNSRVVAVEQEDPWVKRMFGISGIGEGLVLYPIQVDGAAPPGEPEAFSRLMFKAKGEKHRTMKASRAVQVNASTAATIDEFVHLVVTDARLEQGVIAACSGARDPRLTSVFLTWFLSDVRKESVAELEASRLTWSEVEKALQTRARSWFLRRN